MSKKNWLITGGVVLILAIGMVVGLVAQGKKAGVVTPVVTPTPTKVEEEKLVKYEDEAGFSFEYPERLVIKDLTGEEEYSVLEISSLEHEGKTVIKVVDTKYSSVDDWLKKAKETTEVGGSREIELGGMPGRQIQFENPRRLMTIAIDEGVMFFVESPLEPDGLFWNKVHNSIGSSFVLTEEIIPVAGGEAPVAGGVIYEEEEVIE